VVKQGRGEGKKEEREGKAVISKHFFHTHVHLSSHCLSQAPGGKPVEVMGLMIGRPDVESPVGAEGGREGGREGGEGKMARISRQYKREGEREEGKRCTIPILMSHIP